MTLANSRWLPQDMRPTVSKPAIGILIESREQRVTLYASLTSAGPLCPICAALARRRRFCSPLRRAFWSFNTTQALSRVKVDSEI